MSASTNLVHLLDRARKQRKNLRPIYASVGYSMLRSQPLTSLVRRLTPSSIFFAYSPNVLDGTKEHPTAWTF